MASYFYLALILLPVSAQAIPVYENVVGGRLHFQEFTSSATFVRPGGYSIFNVMCIGGGGAGTTGGGGAGPGGGGGEIVFKQVHLTSNVYVSIGDGGTSEGDGGDTVFGGSLIAHGGQGGAGGQFNAFAKGGAGGADGSSYDVCASSSAYCASPIVYANGGTLAGNAGGGGGGILTGSINGRGGNAGTGGTAATVGTYGSGGGGGDAGTTGANGGVGYCLVWW